MATQVCVDKGVFAAAKPGTLFLDCSTIDPSVSRELACAAAGFKVGPLPSPRRPHHHNEFVKPLSPRAASLQQWA
jgi:hypothetical protein